MEGKQKHPNFLVAVQQEPSQSLPEIFFEFSAKQPLLGCLILPLVPPLTLSHNSFELSYIVWQAVPPKHMYVCPINALFYILFNLLLFVKFPLIFPQYGEKRERPLFVIPWYECRSCRPETIPIRTDMFHRTTKKGDRSEEQHWLAATFSLHRDPNYIFLHLFSKRFVTSLIWRV